MRHQRNNSHASLENALLLHRAGRLEEAESLYRKMPSNPDALHLRGVIAHQLNRNEQAVELIDRAIGVRPANAAYHFSLDMAYRALNRLDQVEAAYRRLLERTPDNALIHHRLGNALKDLGRGDEAISTYRKAVLLKPDFAAAYNDMGLVHADRGETDAAVDCYRRALALDPAYAPAHANLGVTLRRRCEPEQAEACYRKAISFDPGFAAAHSNLGNVLQEQGRLEEAINCFQEAVRLEQNNAAFQVNLGNGLLAQDRLEEAQACYATALALAPGLPEAHSQLGCLLARQGKAAEAVACHLQAIALRPNFPEAFNELGAVFRDQGKLQEAVDCGETAVTLKPDFPEAFNNLGLALSHQGKAERAIECFERAVALKPDFAGVYSNLGLVFHNLGRTAEAIACHRKAIDCDPEFATGYTNLLLSAQYSSAFTPEELFAEHARFGARFEAPLKPHWRTHDNSRDAHRRLKIGYVSPDFRRHAVAYFIEPLLACHDKSQVEVFCYYNHTQHDPVTARLQALADHWIPCRHLSDERLAERIRADGIDILIDLAGHTAGNRLLAFARKPAPLQVTYLGYPATTGLSAIDYRITDVHAEPPAMTEQFNVERLWRLPEIFCCYRAHDNSPGVIDHPPALDNGCITFGCFNNFSKVTDAVLELWARILQQVPDARLLLEIQGIDHPPFRAEVEQRMARLGLPLQRLLLEPRRPENQYALYNRIDIALDPFPCNGGTTSLDTVWMGVPFVTLAGRHFTARMGVTILTNAGLPQLIASCEDDYVAIASALARDLPRLRELRAGLRDRVQASPLMDAPRFARHFEQALRSMWRIWCGEQEHEPAGGPGTAEPDLQAAVDHHLAGRLHEAEAIYRMLPDHSDALHLRGVIAHQSNRNEEALVLIERAIAIAPDNAAYYFSMASAWRALGRTDQAAACYRRLLERMPDHADARNNLGNALRELGDVDAAAACYQEALALKPDFPEAHNNLGILFKELGDPVQAEACCRKALELKPDFAAAHNNLGLALAAQHRIDDAVVSYRKALELNPDFAEAYGNLGLAYKDQDRLDEAAASYQQALTRMPQSAEMHNNLGLVFKESGALGDAVDCYLKAIELKRDFAEVYSNLGLVFSEQGNPDAAMECHCTALAFRPDSAEAHNNLGIELRECGRLDEAAACFRTALELKPDYVDAHCNLGITLQRQGKPDDAVACCRNALRLKPDYAAAQQILLLSAQYSSAFTPEELFAEHARFGARFEAPLKPHWRTHDNSRDAHRRLKIGYVSPDFRRHAVAYFIEPLLACHDKSQVEVFCYYNHTQHDPVTARLQALADHWIPCRHLSDERLAERIRADGIDILIDLAGHTAGNRLLAFARKPAPLQVTYLGYPATTGLSAIDYRITDVHAEPPAMTEQFNVERLWRLPEIFCCYRAHDNSPGVIDHPPALDNGCITFGCFNNFSKVTDAVLELWARILQQVPDARLLLEIQGIDHPPFRAEVEQRMARLGLPLQRLLLEPRRPENQYALYNRIDIALDPFPCNGGTTSLDTVWMGVPFVTLAGRHFTARMGVTILTNAGLPQLIASCEDDYVAIASALARDLPRLRELRAGLRDRVQASPLMDAPRFARHFEQALRSMWRIWCEQTQVQGTNA